MLRSLPQKVPVQFEVFPLAGGLDLHTPQLSLKPGAAREAVNFELGVSGGYTRIAGYERFDGRASPSDARYGVMEVALTGALAVGNTLTGGTSGATGVVATIDGSIVVVTKINGVFADGEAVAVGASTVGTIISAGVAVYDLAKDAVYALAAKDIYRADIQAVPGDGAVRGILSFGGSIFAWRDSADGTQCLPWKATTDGWQAVSLPAGFTFHPGGRFEFDIGNAGRGTRAYGCNGLDKGFEFDGVTITPITTGMAADTPNHVKVHKKHLFFSFGPSLQNSSLGDPLTWGAITGAAELLMDDDITALVVLTGDSSTAALGVLTAGKMSVLYGTSAADWQLTSTIDTVGASPYSAQSLNQPYFTNDRGIMSLQAVQAFGNFQSATLTERLRSFIQPRRLLVTDSLVNREKSQYRVFFSDGWGLYATIVNGRYQGAMPVRFPNAVAVACSGATTNGVEVSYFGSTNGFVYRLDVGGNFDGQAISAMFAAAFSFQGNARVRKRYRQVVFELQGDGYAEFLVGYDLGYGSELVDQQSDQYAQSIAANPAFWDEFIWDAFTWDGRTVVPGEMTLDGVAENVSLRVSQNSALWPQYTINSVTLRYTPRRIMR